MRAAQDNAVRPGVQKGLQRGADGRIGLGAVQDAFFHEFHETVPHVFDDVDIVLEASLRLQVLGTFERTRRRQDADDTGLRSERSGFHGRFHAHERDVRVLLPECGDGGRRSGVAGDDDDVGSHPQEDVRDGTGAVPDIFRRFFPVRAVRVVGVIDIPLVREQFHDFPIDGKPAGTRVEYADGCHTIQIYGK